MDKSKAEVKSSHKKTAVIIAATIIAIAVVAGVAWALLSKTGVISGGMCKAGETTVLTGGKYTVGEDLKPGKYNLSQGNDDSSYSYIYVYKNKEAYDNRDKADDDSYYSPYEDDLTINSTGGSAYKFDEGQYLDISGDNIKATCMGK